MHALSWASFIHITFITRLPHANNNMMTSLFFNGDVISWFTFMDNVFSPVHNVKEKQISNFSTGRYVRPIPNVPLRATTLHFKHGPTVIGETRDLARLVT